MPKHIKFTIIGEDKIAVISKKYQHTLGIVKEYKFKNKEEELSKFCYFPNWETLYDNICLEDICDLVNELDNEILENKENIEFDSVKYKLTDTKPKTSQP